MTLIDLYKRLERNVPGPKSGFIAEVNRVVGEIWRERKWLHFMAETTFTTTHTFSNLTVTNGSGSATVVDADANGYFDALHDGKTLTIVDQGYTIDSVTDSNTVVIDQESDDTGAGLAGSVPRVVFALPSAASTNFRQMVKVFKQGYEETDVLLDPDDYILQLPSSGVTTLELQESLFGSTDYVVRYVRAHIEQDGLDDTLDVDDELTDAVYHALEAHYLRMYPPQNELTMLPWQRRVSAADDKYEKALNGAKKKETLRRRSAARNEKVMFRWP